MEWNAPPSPYPCNSAQAPHTKHFSFPKINPANPLLVLNLKFPRLYGESSLAIFPGRKKALNNWNKGSKTTWEKPSPSPPFLPNSSNYFMKSSQIPSSWLNPTLHLFFLLRGFLSRTQGPTHVRTYSTNDLIPWLFFSKFPSLYLILLLRLHQKSFADTSL